METKRILEKFIEAITDTLTEWVVGATRLKTNISAASKVVPFDFHSLLRQIDSKLHAFKFELNKLAADYKELEDTYGLKPLSLEYLTEYAIVFKRVEDALTAVKVVIEKYVSIIEHAKKYDIKIDKYITPKNQKALDRIQHLTSENLLEILNDIHLLDL